MDKKTKDYYLHCGIKSAWHDKTLRGYTNDDEALQMVSNYLKKWREYLSEGIGVYLYGANGTGKSHLMNCAFKHIISEGGTVRVFSMDEIVDKFTASWYSDEEKRDLDHILRNVAFLGIDEFGKNIGADGKPMYLPDFVKRIMESIIRYRVQMNKPIWIASNTEPKFVKEVFSEDIASLLNEAVVLVQVCGSDYRKVIQRKRKNKLKEG